MILDLFDLATDLGIALIFVVIGRVIKILAGDNFYDFYICLIYVLLATLIRTYWLGM